MIVAIHQPNFFPWLGYFNKIARSRHFILLDDVQFPKTGGNWANRVMILLGGKAFWWTAPVARAFHGVRSFRETEFNEDSDWRSRMAETLAQGYRKAPRYREVMPWLEPMIRRPGKMLCEYNLANVRELYDRLAVPGAAKLVLSSDLRASGQGTELLIDLVRKTGGDTYMCGGGAGGYQEDHLFTAAGLGLEYQSFQHPTYPQQGAAAGAFVPGLSVIDALMNLGIEGTRDLLSSGRTA